MKPFNLSDPQTAVLQIPSYDNDCDSPTLLVGPKNAEFFFAQDEISSLALDEAFQQVQNYYSHDPEALHRFSYYLFLKAQEILENNKKSETKLAC